MQPATTLPEDIKELAGLLGKTQGMPGDAYLERFYRDMRFSANTREGGIAALRAEVAALEEAEARAAEEARKRAEEESKPTQTIEVIV